MVTATEKGMLLHVGLPKTGTTTLQRSIFAGHSQIYYLGKTMSSAIPHACRSTVVHDILKEALWQLKKPLAVEKSRNIYEKQLLPEVPSGKLLVGSWEGFGTSAPWDFIERLKRLQLIFGRCRIMITLRNPLTRTPSEFLQNIKGHFLRQNRPWMGSALYLEIEDWFKKRAQLSQGSHNFLGYSQNIQSAISHLGEDNVGVFLFEELKANPEEYYRGICRFMGIDENEGLQLSCQKHLNKRIRQQQVDFLKALNASWWRRMLVRRKSLQERVRLWDQAISIYGGDKRPVQVSMPRHLEQEIIAATREGNRWLVENLALPLEKYGYPL
jgi:hypothetical protein